MYVCWIQMAVDDAVAVQIHERIDDRIEDFFCPACFEPSALNHLRKICSGRFANNIHKALPLEYTSARSQQLSQMGMGQRLLRNPIAQYLFSLGLHPLSIS